MLNPYEPGRPRTNNLEHQSLGCFPLTIVMLLGVGGTVGLILGSMWLYTFTLTDYRSHHAPFMIPFAVFVLLASAVAIWFAKFIVRPGIHGIPPTARDDF